MKVTLVELQTAVGIGPDAQDSTSKRADVPDFAKNLKSLDQLESQPLKGKRIAIISETLGEGVDASVSDAIKKAAGHMEALGATLDEVYQ